MKPPMDEIIQSGIDRLHERNRVDTEKIEELRERENQRQELAEKKKQLKALRAEILSQWIKEEGQKIKAERNNPFLIRI